MEDVQGEMESASTSSTGDLDADKRSLVESMVDQSALDDAISSKVSPVPSVRESSTAVVSLKTSELPILSTEVSGEKASISSGSEQGVGGGGEGEEEEKKTIRELEIITPKALPAFLKKTVHLQEGDDPFVTGQRKVYFLLVCSFHFVPQVATDRRRKQRKDNGCWH